MNENNDDLPLDATLERGASQGASPEEMRQIADLRDRLVTAVKSKGGDFSLTTVEPYLIIRIGQKPVRF